ncbi:hypothetical protein MASR2M39_26430 [Ignavibacteriales bacterium]
MTNLDLKPIELRDYALAIGWTLIDDAIQDGLFVLNSPDKDYKQLIFPTDNENPDFVNQVSLALDKLSGFTKKNRFQVINEIRTLNDDLISLRYYSNENRINSISFQDAVDSIEAAKQMLLAAGSSIINPALFHPRLYRNESNELLKKARFRHTEEGSFILNISYPLSADEFTSENLFGEEEIKPFGRSVFELINSTSYSLTNAITSNKLDELLEKQQQSSSPELSYNLCDALSNFFPSVTEVPFEMRFRYSPNFNKRLKSIPSKLLPSSVKFHYEYKAKIDEFKQRLYPEKAPSSDTFVGTVESLNGNEGKDGRREGEVMLALLVDSEIVNAKVLLNADEYEVAYKAHIKKSGYVGVKGVLSLGRRQHTLKEISDFKEITT